MTDPQVMIATTAYEIREKKEPRGIGNWSISFRASFFDQEKLRLAAQAHNATKKDGFVSVIWNDGSVMLVFGRSSFGDARRAAAIIAKLSALASVHTIIGEVIP